MDAWPDKGDLDPAIARTAVVDGTTYGVPWWVAVQRKLVAGLAGAVKD